MDILEKISARNNLDDIISRSQYHFGYIELLRIIEGLSK